jgi:hypothetical protein
MHDLSSKSFLIISIVSVIAAVMWFSAGHQSDAAGNTYSVSPNGSGSSCSSSSPCALDTGLHTLRGGETLILNGGVYTQRLDIPGGKGGSGERTHTVIRVAQGATVLLTGNGNALAATGAHPYLTVTGEHGTRIFDPNHTGDAAISCDTPCAFLLLKEFEIRQARDHGLLFDADRCQVLNGHSHHSGVTESGTVTCHRAQNPGGDGVYNRNHGQPGLIDGGQYHHHDGAGINVLEGSFTIRHTKLVSTALTSPHDALGMYDHTTGTTIDTNLIWHNNAGGMILAQGAAAYNNTIVGNGGTGIADWGDGGTICRNNIVYNNRLDTCNSSSHNLTSDPHFVNPSAGDFRLTSASTNAINTGTSLPDVPCNFAGNTRPAGSTHDIGAYEYGSTASLSTQCAKGFSGSSPPPFPSPQIPHITLNAIPSQLSPGGTSLLQWSVQHATSCTASDSWSGSRPLSGTQSVSPQATSLYTLSCTGSGGSHAASVTITIGTTAPCHQCTSSTPLSQIPQGFGVPWDVFAPSTLVMAATCSGSIAQITLNDPPNPQYPYRYVYEHIHYAPDGSSGWTEATLTGPNKITNAWFPNKAQTLITLPDPTATTYVIGYLCTYTGQAWKCGCRDSACTQSFWQIQKIQQ